MTSRQLVRRAKLVEAVVELVGEVGGPAVQMRDVAERSGVALGTLYRYFTSKDHLLAVALAEWQQRLTRRVLASSRSAGDASRAQVSGYLARALSAFHRSPRMAQLMVQEMTSTDPDVISSLEHMRRSSDEVWRRHLSGLPPEDLPYVIAALDSILMTAVGMMATGRATLEEASDRVQGVVRILLDGR